ncbi:tetratricopeptide repeat protein [Motiliproteus sediminis]|uniref:tetratricopeptide repeat protein n=1 Tax=Motiliproteus sediminis TaxID=1468178 RepID=UPI001AEF494A|nr:tetratricopeptide repeat protein [Motiliproteus sediminis]
MKAALSLALSLLLTLPLAASAASPDERMIELQDRWAEIRYTVPEEQQEDAYEALTEVANESVKRYPEAAELWIWRGIVLSTYAGAKGGLGALDLVKQARESLEQAITLDDQALAGSAYTSLGALYYQVPGWPLSFGSDKKARHYLEMALSMNPDGIDPNYFYGDFLISQKEYQAARKVLQHALEAPQRQGREIADQGRREEINKLLNSLKEKS